MKNKKTVALVNENWSIKDIKKAFFEYNAHIVCLSRSLGIKIAEVGIKTKVINLEHDYKRLEATNVYRELEPRLKKWLPFGKKTGRTVPLELWELAPDIITYLSERHSLFNKLGPIMKNYGRIMYKEVLDYRKALYPFRYSIRPVIRALAHNYNLEAEELTSPSEKIQRTAYTMAPSIVYLLKKTKFHLERVWSGRWGGMERSNIVLCLPFEVNQVKTSIPLKSLLEKRGFNFLTLRFDKVSNPIKKALEEHKLTYVNIEAFSDGANYKKQAEEFTAAWKSLKKRSFKYNGLEYFPLIEDIMEYYLTKRKKIVEILRYRELLKNALLELRPKVLIIFDDLAEYGRPAARICKYLNVPCVAIQHGNMSRDAWMAEGVKADLHIVTGPRDRENLIKNGANPSQIKVAGQPRFDIIFKRKYDKRKIYEKYGIPKNRKILLVVTQPGIPGEGALVTEALKCTGLKDIHVIIKLHPSGEKDDVSEFLEGFDPTKYTQVRQENIYDLIDASFAICTISSTVATESLIMGKPVFIVNLERAEEIVPYVKEGAAVGIYQPDKLKEALRKLLKGKRDIKVEKFKKNAEKFVYNYAYKQDGKAAERIVAEIIKIIGESK